MRQNYASEKDKRAERGEGKPDRCHCRTPAQVRVLRIAQHSGIARQAASSRKTSVRLRLSSLIVWCVQAIYYPDDPVYPAGPLGAETQLTLGENPDRVIMTA